jgi:hypothetical protein
MKSQTQQKNVALKGSLISVTQRNAGSSPSVITYTDGWNTLPWTNDTQKRYYISIEDMEGRRICGIYKKNLAKISLLLKKTNTCFFVIHLDTVLKNDIKKFKKIKTVKS